MKFKIISLYLICVVFLASCGGVTPYPTALAASPTFASTATAQIPTLTPASVSTNSRTTNLLIVQSPNSDWLTHVPEQSGEKIYSVSISNDKTLFIIYTSLGIYFYNTKTLKQERIISEIRVANSGNHAPIALSSDGRYLAVSNGNQVVLQDIDANRKIGEFSHPSKKAQDFYLEFNPNGDRILLTSYVSEYYSDGIAVNFSLYNLNGELLFEKYFPGDFTHYYYRLTEDEKLYLFFGSMYSESFPLELYIVDTQTGKILSSVVYNFETNSYNSENVFYDISPDGKIMAVSLVQDGENKTQLIDAQTHETLEILNVGSVELLPKTNGGDSVQWKIFTNQVRRGGWFLPDYQIAQKCNQKIDPETGFISFGNKMMLLIPSFRDIKAVEIWDTSTCRLENGIALFDSEK